MKRVKSVGRAISVIAVFVNLSSCFLFQREKPDTGLAELLLIGSLFQTPRSSCASAGWGAALPFDVERKMPAYEKGEVLVSFREGVSTEQRAASLSGMRDLNQSFATSPGARPVHRVLLRRGESVQDAVDRLGRDPSVLQVQPNFRYYASVEPGDPSFAEQWGLHNTGQVVHTTPYTPGLAGFDVGAVEAWDTRTDCSSVVVAVLDSGVNYEHEDLAANMWDDGFGHHGYDLVRETSDPLDLNGHGTHVAGIIGAAGGPTGATGGVGVCWKAKIMAVRVLDASGSGTSASVARGIRWAVDHGARVINASLGGPAGYSGDVIDQSIAYAREHGVLFVAAAGNSGMDNDTFPSFPASYDRDNIISVGAVDSSGRLAYYSNYGASCVDMAAPGVSIYSSLAGDVYYNGSTTSASTTEDSFPETSGPLVPTAWTFDSNWGHVQQTYAGGNYWQITNPKSISASSQWWTLGMAANTDLAYAVFDASRFPAPYVTFYADYELYSGDSLQVLYGTTNAPPTSVLDTITGSSAAGFMYNGHDLTSSCGQQASCAIGFRMNALAARGPGYGAGITGFEFVGLDTTAKNVYGFKRGTSMAAPFVTGVAALVWAEHPGASYSQVRQALFAGGKPLASLSGKTVTGKMVHAAGALSSF